MLERKNERDNLLLAAHNAVSRASARSTNEGLETDEG